MLQLVTACALLIDSYCKVAANVIQGRDTVLESMRTRGVARSGSSAPGAA